MQLLTTADMLLTLVFVAVGAFFGTLLYELFIGPRFRAWLKRRLGR